MFFGMLVKWLDGKEAAESVWKGICLLMGESRLLKSSITKWPLSAIGGWSEGGVVAVLRRSGGCFSERVKQFPYWMPSYWVPVELAFGGWYWRVAGLWRPPDKHMWNGWFFGSSCRFFRKLGTGHESVVVCYPRKKQDLFPGLSGGFGRPLLASADAV